MTLLGTVSLNLTPDATFNPHIRTYAIYRDGRNLHLQATQLEAPRHSECVLLPDERDLPEIFKPLESIITWLDATFN